jgi:hypothetical protein
VQVIQLLPALEKEKRADVLLALLPYLYPKRKSVEPHGEEQEITGLEFFCEDSEKTA